MKTKKIFLGLVVISLFLNSCGGKIPTGNYLDDPYVVKSINELERDFCVYSVSTGAGYVNYRNNIEVVDSIGKFAIGDTIIFKIEKL